MSTEADVAQAQAQALHAVQLLGEYLAVVLDGGHPSDAKVEQAKGLLEAAVARLDAVMPDLKPWSGSALAYKLLQRRKP